jgi:hypothetical protein
MKVRMLQQISGSRQGQPWPAPGEEIDLSDAEARSAISGGTAEALDTKHDTVLVPPAGIHTPGTVAFGDTPLVAVPVDGVADPDGTRAALKTVAEGGSDKTVPYGTGVQAPDGSAMTEKGVDESVKAEEVTREDLGVGPVAGAKSTGVAPKTVPAAKSTTSK